MLGIGLYLVISGGDIFDTMSQMVAVPMLFFHLPYEEAMAKAVPVVIDSSIALVAPVVGIIMALAFIGIISQTGFLFAPKAAMPKLENLDPKKWFQKVFSVKNFFELAKNIVKADDFESEQLSFANIDETLPNIEEEKFTKQNIIVKFD